MDIQRFLVNLVVPQYGRRSVDFALTDKRVLRSVLDVRLVNANKAVSKSQHTCNTYKGFGLVVFRPVHASAGHAYASIVSWVSMVLGSVLQRCSHLVVSSI